MDKRRMGRVPAQPAPGGEGNAVTHEGKACQDQVLDVFPNLCLDYLGRLVKEYNNDHQAIVNHILQEVDNGRAYPTRERKAAKRKHEDDDDDNFIDENGYDKKARDVIRHYDKVQRGGVSYLVACSELLRYEFCHIKVRGLRKAFEDNAFLLLPTYLAISKVEDSGAVGNHPYLESKTVGPRMPWKYREPGIDQTIRNSDDEGEKKALVEFRAARNIRTALLVAQGDQRRKAFNEEQNHREERAKGNIVTCECCFDDDVPKNRSVQCNGETTHIFCRDCCRRNAEIQIGNSKYELVCMSSDGCSAGFSKEQRELFLDDKLKVGLEKAEQEAALRLAGIENLEICPFCPFAAEYPSIEEDKEFRCQNPDCEVVSCRLCRKETHIPQSCQEAAAQDNVHGARRRIEEAMSEALIRKCNKCRVPFVKQDGCNKMTCPRNGCGNEQCYICHQDCDYTHFDDRNIGGKAGGCPLYDAEGIEKRHSRQVKAAEEAARRLELDNHPGIDADALMVNAHNTRAKIGAKKAKVGVKKAKVGAKKAKAGTKESKADVKAHTPYNRQCAEECTMF